MGTTADKLTYLNETKGKIKDSINLTGAGITNEDTFRSYATKLRDGLVQVLNDNGETLYNNFPKVSGSGSEITLENTLEAPMKNGTIDGDTLQDGEPTPDTPVEIQSVEGIQNVSIIGKNLLPFTNQDFTYKNVRYYVQNGSLYLDGTSTGETGVNITKFKNNFSFTLPPGTYVFNRGQNGDAVSLPSYIRKYSDNSTLATNWGKFTLQEETKVFLGFYIYNKIFDNNFIDIRLEKGDNITTYEEHKEQTYEVNLEGKNLFDYTQIPNADVWPNWASSGGRQLEFKVKPNTQYTLSSNVPQGSSTLLYFNGDSTATNGVWVNNPKTMTSDNNGKLYVYFFNNRDYYSDIANNTYYIQLEEGSEATSYTPYRSPIKLYDGDKIVGTPDNWSVVKNWIKFIFNGSEDGWSSDGNTGDIYRYKKLLSDTTSDDNNKCSHFKYLFNYTSQTLHFYISDTGRLYIFCTDITLNDFKTWLSNNNIEIVGKLATPITEAITDTYLISQLNALYNAKSYDNQTNISVSGNLPMILEVSALKGDE